MIENKSILKVEGSKATRASSQLFEKLWRYFYFSNFLTVLAPTFSRAQSPSLDGKDANIKRRTTSLGITSTQWFHPARPLTSGASFKQLLRISRSEIQLVFFWLWEGKIYLDIFLHYLSTIHVVIKKKIWNTFEIYITIKRINDLYISIMSGM